MAALTDVHHQLHNGIPDSGVKGRSFTHFKILVLKGEINSILRQLTAQSCIS